MKKKIYFINIKKILIQIITIILIKKYIKYIKNYLYNNFQDSLSISKILLVINFSFLSIKFSLSLV